MFRWLFKQKVKETQRQLLCAAMDLLPVTAYCVICGESPMSATHLGFGDHDYEGDTAMTRCQHDFENGDYCVLCGSQRKDILLIDDLTQANREMHDILINVRTALDAWDTPYAPSGRDIQECILRHIAEQVKETTRVQEAMMRIWQLTNLPFHDSDRHVIQGIALAFAQGGPKPGSEVERIFYQNSPDAGEWYTEDKHGMLHKAPPVD